MGVLKRLLCLGLLAVASGAAARVPVARFPAARDSVARDSVARVRAAGDSVARRHAPIDTLSRIIRQPVHGRTNRGIFHYLFVPKGEWMMGAQLSFGSFSSDDSEYLLLIEGLNARGNVVRVVPFFAYFYRPNQAVGAQFSYRYLSADVRSARVAIGDDDLDFDLDGIRARQRTYKVSLFQRSYIGLDVRGRFALFNETNLGYAVGKTVFSYNEASRGTYTRNRQLSLTFHPGLAVFIMNNVSIHASIGVGGLHYNVVRYVDQQGHRSGHRSAFRADFRVNVTDIRIGMSIHFWKNNDKR